ncbi:MAG: fibronectin type III domain-containing protein [Acidobacteria bacterium]|nr:fibronectin type III domain-containing protein [Acidobacteriota bacterium]
MTQITRKSVPMRGLILLLAMFLGAGLVLTGCGDDETTTTPAPAPPPPPPPAPEPEPEPPPAPEAPATPTGLHVDETTETSITWHWNAVEGAIGYAVQVSMDEMFDANDQIVPTTETHFTASDLPPNTSVYVRVAAAAGTLEAPILSDWTTHVTGMSAMPPPPPPPPMAPATPTGLMAEEGEGSITWMWDAVEGADGYAIQVSADEMFDDMDETTYTMETSHTVEDLGYSETRYARVASTSGEGEAMLMSMFTTHVTGMSMAEPPPPPPPPPDPVMVTFSLSDDADSPHFLIADDDDDEATAMATVNAEIMVESNASAVITPMFVDGANGVGVNAGSGNMPFTFVDWGLLQADALSAGATFMIQRTVIGANQEMEPSGDVAYVTCGPFECADGMDAPELSIANSSVCTAWDPSVEIMVGKVDNDVLGRAADGELESNDGVDLGIVTSSSIAMKVKHVFSGVAGGTNTSSTVDAAKGSNKTLAMKAVTGGGRDVIMVSADADDTDTANIDDSVICDNMYTTEDVSSKVDRPGGSNCFRLVGPGAGRTDNDASKGPDYLAGWTIELSPVDADVSWGAVDWDDDPFEDLECGGADPITVSDHVDICDMFDAEVDLATGKGWSPEVVFDADNRVVMWRAGAKAGTGESMFKTIWFDDNLNGKILKDTTGRGARRPDPDGAGAGTAEGAQATIHDLYDQDESDNNIDKIWQFLTDDDGDLVDSVGDLGKVDLVSDNDDPKTADNETTIALEACASGVTWRATTAAQIATGCGGTDGTDGTAATEQTGRVKTSPDGNADNYVNAADSVAFSDFRGCSEDDGGDDADGSECDAEWVNEVEILFADGTFGCSTTRTVTVTCTWDADGGMAQGRNALPTAAVNFDNDPDDGTNNLGHFLKCEAE